MSRKVILFELNEVPWRVVDDYVAGHSDGLLAKTLSRSQQYVTLAADVGHLSPWTTWPTMHRGVPDVVHMIGDLGQDRTAADAAYPPLWQLLHEAGVEVGVCGSLHSYPPPDDLESYAFFLPDTFATDDRAHPATLSKFQTFNLSMARESGRNVDTGISWRRAAGVLASSRALGIRAATYRSVLDQLAAERRHRWRSTRRRTIQAMLAFDVFMKQLERAEPGFATFFTNHVASSMHRYWAATYPGDYEVLTLDRTWMTTFADEIPWAMREAERMLERLIAFVERHPEYQVWVASSMGQGPTLASALETAVYLVDMETLMRRLGLPDECWETRPAMLPQANVVIDREWADLFEERLSGLGLVDKPLHYRRADGGFFSMDFGQPNLHKRPTPIRYEGARHRLADFGMKAVEVEDHSGTTAYHVPEGILFVHDPSDISDTAHAGSNEHQAAGARRPTVSTLEVAPTLLKLFDVPAPDYMVIGDKTLLASKP